MSSFGFSSYNPQPGSFGQQPSQFGQQPPGAFGQPLGAFGQQQGMVPPGYTPFASVTYNGVPTQVFEKKGFFGNSYYANITGLQKINFKNGQIIPITSGGAATKSRKTVGGSHKRRKRHGTRKHKRRH
jgi:hypothetical protein